MLTLKDLTQISPDHLTLTIFTETQFDILTIIFSKRSKFKCIQLRGFNKTKG